VEVKPAVADDDDDFMWVSYCALIGCAINGWIVWLLYYSRYYLEYELELSDQIDLQPQEKDQGSFILSQNLKGLVHSHLKQGIRTSCEPQIQQPKHI